MYAYINIYIYIYYLQPDLCRPTSSPRIPSNPNSPGTSWDFLRLPGTS